MTYSTGTKVSVAWLARLPDKLDNFSWALQTTPANFQTTAQSRSNKIAVFRILKMHFAWRHNARVEKKILDSTREEDGNQDSKVLLRHHIEV